MLQKKISKNNFSEKKKKIFKNFFQKKKKFQKKFQHQKRICKLILQMQCNKTSLTYQADSEWTQAKLSMPGGRLCSEAKLVSGDRWSQANLTSDRRSQATLFWQVTGETNLFNIFRLCWYGFFVRLALWSVLLVAQTSCHYQMVGSTGSWESLVGQRSYQANRWGGH